MKLNWQHLIIVVIFWGALISPITFYIYTFGFGIWESNDDWGQMGSAIGGLYTPILSLFTFMLLGLQLYRQNQVDHHNQISWFIDRSLKGGEKALKYMAEISQEKNMDNQTVIDGLLSIINNGTQEDVASYLGMPVNQRFFSAATIYFSNLEGLKGSNNLNAQLACEELRTEAAMLLGYNMMIIIEREVLRGMLAHGPYFDNESLSSEREP
ncbi:hypothetical protein [Vibrio sp. TBV020]|uniref:hypothetical protein n=1 Tax=Vibrio sp. TBV020 TaxID=3137398 RepID=UPI0038CDB7B0